MIGRLEFPEGFLWGAATSAHQVEGSNVNSDWWHAEHARRSVVAEPSGDACDSYHRWADDLDLVAGAGLNAYRFSLEWSRIEPEPGELSRAALGHYARMIDGCLERALTPVVTLHHFTLPRWFAREGGWRRRDAADRFARFCEAVLPLCAQVGWVCTINEPNIAAIMADPDAAAQMGRGRGLPEPDPEIVESLVAAHRRAREIVRSLGGVKVGWTVANQAVEADPGYEEEARQYQKSREDQFLEEARDDDFVGVQSYSRTVVGRDGPFIPESDRPLTQMGWEYFPEALRTAAEHSWAVTGGTPIVVTENGIATDDDEERIRYTDDALRGLHEAIAAGVDIRGYLHWSLFDNFEWFAGYRPTFGLVAVDRTTFERRPKRSAGWLGAVARANALHPSASSVHRSGGAPLPTAASHAAEGPARTAASPTGSS
ncbi:MAG TPA: family 1 glycosylhydrolase [Thermoleophilaceae bacterium]|nr:family 1 glycosylhydrolase [Thermoleophilaceae bacterium]